MSNKIQQITPVQFVNGRLIGVLPQPKTPENGVNPLAPTYRKGNVEISPSYGGTRPSSTPLEALDLSARVWKILVRNKIDTLEKLEQTPVKELLKLNNLGLTSLREIQIKLAERTGLTPLGSLKYLPDATYEKLIKVGVYTLEDIRNLSDEKLQQIPVLNNSLDNLSVSVRTYNCLARAGIRTIGRLMQATDEELLQIKNFN